VQISLTPRKTDIHILLCFPSDFSMDLTGPNMPSSPGWECPAICSGWTTWEACECRGLNMEASDTALWLDVA
jgi:hypothetical protein